MIKLTPIGKIMIAIIVVLVVYFFLLPLASIPFSQGENVERKREIKIVAFLKTFDRNSARLQETLRELETDKNMQAMVALNLINIEAEPGKMEQNNINTGEVPCFILGNEKFLGWRPIGWFKGKILELAEQSQGGEA